MQQRKITIIGPLSLEQDIIDIISTHDIDSYRVHHLQEDKIQITALISGTAIKECLNTIDKKRGSDSQIIILVEDIDASFTNRNSSTQDDNNEKLWQKGSLLRIPPQELYNTVMEGVTISPNYYILFAMSAIVAAIGLLESNVSIIIGSMVIAPFLGPNVGLALGTMLGDTTLIKKSSSLMLWGIAIVFSIALLRGLIEPNIISLSDAAQINFSLIIVAFVSGVSAILSLLRGESSALVGVMVAVALLPPLVLCGLLLGGGEFFASFRAFLLFAANVICLNLAGIFTFYLADIKPNKRRKAQKASKRTRNALLIRGVALLVLIIITYQLT